MAALLLVAVALICAELYVRHLGYLPIQSHASNSFPGERYLLVPTFGYRHQAGLHDPSEGAASGERVWPNGQRSSRPLPLVKHPRARVALQGCSWTYGFGAGDHETYAWQLNARYPYIQFDNYGECEYGAFLAHQRMRDIVASGQPYDLYIYAFISDHIERDLRVHWLLPPNNVVYYFPSYELSHPEQSYRLVTSVWWGERCLALMNFIHLAYVHHELFAAISQHIPRDAGLQAFRENVLAMRDLAHAQGSGFALLGLGPGADSVYREALSGSDIDIEFALAAGQSEPGFNEKSDDPGDPDRTDTHPNALGHRKISSACSKLLQRCHLPAGSLDTVSTATR